MTENQTLPNCQNAQIADAKLYKYLLNHQHPDGKSKARFYEQIGYTATDTETAEQLRTDLLRLACSGTVEKIIVNAQGEKYVVVGSIDAPNGKPYNLLTVWAVEPPDFAPRLITAYPN